MFRNGNADLSLSASQVNIEDMFSTYVYTGTHASQTITNDIDLATDGGMVWVKNRSSIADNALFDTERGVSQLLRSNTTASEYDMLTEGVSTFNTDGFDLGGNELVTNSGSESYTSWSFKKQPRFFDMVKYTGDGVAGREIPHNLGCDVGMIIVKSTTQPYHWDVYHKGVGATKYGRLNLTDAFALGSATTFWTNVEPTSSVFTIGNGLSHNALGEEYIAYLFAHDQLGASGDGSDGMIACGSYTGNGSNDGPEIDLGWEPQYLLTKKSSSTSNWSIIDNIRGFTSGGLDGQLLPNEANAEVTTETLVSPLPNGFKPTTTHSTVNSSGATYIYMAIRRPMKTPLSSDEVFAIDNNNGTDNNPAFISDFPVDMALYRRNDIATDNLAISRLTGTKFLKTSATDAEATNAVFETDYNNGWCSTSLTTSFYSWMFKRAKGFFDVVAYTGDGIAGRTVNHNLGVVPEMMWIKERTSISAGHWATYNNTSGATKWQILNEVNADMVLLNIWNNTEPTETLVTLGSNAYVNGNTGSYIAYLFATLAGISKVSSYTGNGTSQTIDCGFSTGAKFVLIKATSTTGDWHIWDTTRGIVAGNDPFLELNTTNAENASYDSIDPVTSGFIVNQDAGTSINASGVSYIYYAIAEPI